MAANMAQMGGGAIPRPPQQQLSHIINQTILQNPVNFNGWQRQVPTQMRIGNAMNLITNSFLAMPQLDSQGLVSHGINFERQAFAESPNKDAYDQRIGGRVQELFRKRQANEHSLQNTLTQQQAAQAQQQAQAQHMMMSMSQQSMQAQMAQGRMGQPPQQGFQHLQQQMQASPIAQQPQQSAMGMPNSVPHPMNLNQSGMPMGASQMRPQGLQNTNMNPELRQKIQSLAMQRYQQMPEPQKLQIRNQMQQQFQHNPQMMQRLQAEGQDLVLFYLQQQLMANMKKQQAQAQAQAQQQQMNMAQNVAGNQNGAQLPQHRAVNGQGPQPAAAAAAAAGVDMTPFSNADIMNQQKQGLMAQEAGQMVVPASGGPGRNTTPQPLGGAQGPNAGNTQPGSNQVGRSHMQQQFNMQQAQQQAQQLKMDQAAQHSQAQIRAQAQAKQMQGQPGGLGGPGAVSQSPAMNTLNAPVPRPPVAMGQQPQMNQGNVPFPQGFNPQFNQGNRPPVNRNQVIQNMLASMPPDMRQSLQQSLQTLPPEKQHEVIMHRARQMAAQRQGQPGQFGQPNPMAQFAQGNNAGQQPNTPMGMNPQNSIMVQQQISRLRNAQSNRPPVSNDKAMAMADAMDVSAHLLQTFSTPPDIKKWGPFKGWIAANPNIQQQTQGQLSSVQSAQFQNLIKQRQAQIQAVQPQMTQASSGQMMPQTANAAAMNPQNSQGPPLAVSSLEIQQVKMKMERFRNVPDEKVKSYLLHVKRQTLAKSGVQPPGQLQAPQVSQPPSTTPMPTTHPSQTQRHTIAGAEPIGAGRGNANNKPASNRQMPQQKPSPAIPQKNGLKRPSSDDVVEVPNPAIPVPRPASQQSQAQAGFPAGMSAEQRAKFEQLRARQSQAASQVQSPEDMNRLKMIAHEEQTAMKKEVMKDIPMSAAEHMEMTQKIRATMSEMGKLAKQLGRWFSCYHDEARTRLFFKSRFRLMRQFQDGDKMNMPRDVFSLSPSDLNEIRELVSGMVKDVVLMMKAASQQNAPPTGSQSSAASSQPAPLNAANLEKNAQAYNKIQRTGSKSGQPPAAPTTSQPPFAFGAQSPHGQPAYIGKPAVTQDTLQLPARAHKKAKTGPQSSCTGASPQVSKQPSPEIQKRLLAMDTKGPSKPRLQCPEANCMSNNWGFANDETLQVHFEEEHVKPYEDPIKFATESFELALGVGQEDNAKPRPEGTPNLSAPPMAGNLSRQGQTQTPASISHECSMKREGSNMGARPMDMIKPAPGKLKGNGAATPIKMEDFTAPQPTSFGTIDPQNLFQNLGGMESGGGGAISDMNVYRSITPNDTPESSKDSASSEPNSDVSEGVALNVTLDMGFDTWQPFEGDRYVNFADMDVNMLEGADLTVSDPLMGFTSWDDVNLDASKPFALDTSLYSLDPTT